MDWLHHPRFARERRRVLDQLRRDRYDFRRIKKVIFLCGGFRSTRRDTLNAYLERYSEDCLVFYAEAVWALIASTVPAANALAMEEKLAALSDIVIVIVESPGTFAEVGAFALSGPLREKLLPVMDVAHRGGDSFLSTGPIRWVDEESRFRPTIWTNLNQILLAAGEIDDRLKRIPKTKPMRVLDLEASPKHLIFFICDLVAVFGPCPREHIVGAVAELLPPGVHIDVDLYLGLGKAMKLLRSFQSEGEEMFFRVLVDGKLLAFQRRRHLDLSTLRSHILSAMQACAPCAPALAELDRQT